MSILLIGLLWLGFLPGRQSSASQTPTISPADQAVLEKLDETTKDELFSSAMLERSFPRSDMARWKRLQRLNPPSTEYGLDIAFLLAYYHVDYKQNIDRLLWPYKMWLQARTLPEQQWTRLKSKTRMDDSVDLASLSLDSMGLLGDLYDTRQDIHALQLVCRMWLTGGPGEGQADDITDYWLHHPEDLMRAAAGEINSQRNIAEVLVASDDMEPELPPPAKTIARLRKLVHSQDARVAAGARGVLQAALAFLHPRKQARFPR